MQVHATFLKPPFILQKKFHIYIYFLNREEIENDSNVNKILPSFVDLRRFMG